MFGASVKWLEDRHLTSIRPFSCPSRLSPQSPLAFFIRVHVKKIEAPDVEHRDLFHHEEEVMM